MIQFFVDLKLLFKIDWLLLFPLRTRCCSVLLVKVQESQVKTLAKKGNLELTDDNKILTYLGCQGVINRVTLIAFVKHRQNILASVEIE